MRKDSTQNFFEKHPKKTLVLLNILVWGGLWWLCNLEIINNQHTENHDTSIKTIMTQAYIGNMIDSNVGRYIKLREFPPNQVLSERPSRSYMKHIAPNSIERKYYIMRTDEHGFIKGPDPQIENPDLQIVFLGGSTTECRYVDEAYRFPYLVSKDLSASLGKKVKTYNSGMSANESMHSLNIMMNKVLPLKPDYVVMMHNINDLVMLRAQGTYFYPDSLKSHVQTAKNLFTRNEIKVATHHQTDKQLKQKFAQNIKTFIAITRVHEIEPVLMTQANRVDNDPLYLEFNDVIRDIAKEEKVALIDLENQIPKTTDYLYDHYHYTQSGSVMASKVIQHTFAELIKSKKI